jgi:putative ABC transport system substrate-binding protein
MRRRDFITGIAGSAAVWPLAGRAQQSAVPVVGYLASGSPDRSAGRVGAFRQGLGESGYVEGQNVAVEYRWAESRNERLPALAMDLVRRQVGVIAARGVPAALAAKAATTTIPVVFNVGVNPVEVGLVASFNRPGGNLTGVSSLNVELDPKRFELLHELVPKAKVVGLLVNPTNRNAAILSRDLQSAARTLGVELHLLHASSEVDFDAVFASLRKLRAGALVIGTDGFFFSHSELLAALTVRHAVPAIFQYRDFAAAGGLASYGGILSHIYRQVGVYAGRILKGEKPADLPVDQATKVELVINLKTAKALGLTVPLPLIGRADELIE